jgi:NADP-dependent 3-hydroxy acid dehydrogenase YdfG
MTQRDTKGVAWIAGVGARAGLGTALARRFARDGYTVAVSARNAERLASVVDDIRSAGGQEDEVILRKIFDSREDGTARLTAHTAFDHPRTREDAPRRRSIELRTLLFWE